MKLRPYFTTAGFVRAGVLPRVFVGLAALALYGASMSSASAQSDDLSCTEAFALQPSVVQAQSDSLYGSWWFEPTAAARSALPTTLPLVPADSERFLGANNDGVLLRWQAGANANAPADMRWAQRESYLVVRADEPVLDMNGQPLGRFVRLIAKARWDERIWVDQSLHNTAVREWVVPLRLERVTEEVSRGDQVLPRRCVQLETPQSTPLREDLSADAVATQARVVGLMNAHGAPLMGAHNSIAIMDRGAAHGVTQQQRWVLIESLDGKDNKTASTIPVARQRATVRIVQVLPRYSIVQIQNAEREVLRGTYLKRVDRVTNAPERPMP